MWHYLRYEGKNKRACNIEIYQNTDLRLRGGSLKRAIPWKLLMFCFIISVTSMWCHCVCQERNVEQILRLQIVVRMGQDQIRSFTYTKIWPPSTVSVVLYIPSFYWKICLNLMQNVCACHYSKSAAILLPWALLLSFVYDKFLKLMRIDYKGNKYYKNNWHDTICYRVKIINYTWLFSILRISFKVKVLSSFV